MRKILIFLGLVFLLAVQMVYAQSSGLDLVRQQKLLYGDVIRTDEIGTFPSEIQPGGQGTIYVKIRNAGENEIKNIVVQIIPPAGISFLDDVSKRKIPVLGPSNSYEMNFSIIASPTILEGVYSSYVSVHYLNKIGEEKEDNDTFALVVMSKPNLFVKIDNSELYKGNGIGDVTITFVNNNVANIKFLTVELLESEDYDIVSTNRMYIGDLDSDDFESVDFTLKLLNEKDYVTLPLKIAYKDALNNDYSESVNVDLRVRDARELGKSTNNTWIIVIIAVAILIVIYLIFRSFRKRKEYSKDGFHIGRK